MAVTSQRTEYVLVIAGLGTEFCTHKSMEAGTTTDGRIRRVGLKREGIRIEERVDIVDAWFESSPMTLEIVDVEEEATQAFAQLASQVTWLTSDITSSATTIPVTSTSGFSANDYITIGTECIKIGTVNAGASQFESCTRDVRSTLPQAHYTEDGERLRTAVITDRPETIEGRRAFLYEYPIGTSLTANVSSGLQIWAGVCATDAELDGTTWRITLDPLERVLHQDLGAGLDEPVSPRGIYYHAGCKLTLEFREGADATRGGGYASDTATVTFPDDAASGVGFYETQEAFCAALTTAISTAVSGWTRPPNIYAVAHGSTGWSLLVEPNATARYIYTSGGSPIDGEFGPAVTLPGDVVTAEVFTVTASNTYEVQQDLHLWAGGAVVPGHRSVPRGWWGWAPGFEVPGGSATLDLRKVYLNTGVPLTGMGGAGSVWPALIHEEVSGWMEITAVDNTERSITLGNAISGHRTPHYHKPYTSAGLPTFTLERGYSSTDVGALIAEIVADAPTYQNAGTSPDITGGDVDTSAVIVAVNAAARGRPLVTQRQWWMSRAEKLDEVLREEFKLLGVVPCLKSNGLLTVREPKMGLATDPSALAFTTSHLVPGSESWRKNALGSIHTARVHHGYNWSEDKWDGPLHVVRSVTAVSRNKLAQVLECKPLSTTAPGAPAPTWQDVVDLFETRLGLFGGPYAIVEWETPDTATVGSTSAKAILTMDPCTLTFPTLPSWAAGTRFQSGGMNAAPGIIIGRDRDPASGVIRFTALVTGIRLAGYAPTLGITTQSGTDPDWTITVQFGDPLSVETDWAGSTDVLSDHYAVGDKIQICQFNATSPTTVNATIDSAGINDGAGTLDITTDSTWTPGTNKWLVRFQGASVTTTNMERYAYYAGSDRLINLQSGDVAARVFAP